MKRPSLKTALIGTIFSLVALSAVMSMTSITAMGQMGQNNDQIIKKWLPSVSASKEINVAVAGLRAAYSTHVLASDADGKTKAEQAIVTANDYLDKTMVDYQKYANGSEDVRMLDDIKKQLVAYNKMGKSVLFYSKANRDKEARMYLQSMNGLGANIDKIVEKVVDRSAEGAAADGLRSQALIDNSMSGNIALSVIALFFGMGAIVFVLRGIARPIGHITASMRNLADGDTSAAIPFAGRSDEIGAMAATVEVFRQAAITNKQLERDAELMRSRAEAERREAERKAEAEADERLRAVTAGLAAGLHRLADGDLAFQLTERFTEQFEPLRVDFNQSVEQLGGTLSEITNSIHQMENSSREIAAGANDLSRRTEQQAASLEETAAALDEITTNVRNSTQRSEEARDIATRANSTALKSAEVVSHAEDAMRKIEQSSKQISDILSVIDEIAFQTNLLALNAGVEAARAGDAGKGFAVVAQEVRELAQRSAKAAKEIKDVINNSGNDVANGVKLVRDAGETLKAIGGFIVEINLQVEAIALSAREQSLGLSEVNTAINHMDQATQQNAAMVEQSTAASASLAEEAGTLRSLIRRFKLENSSGDHAQTLRGVAREMSDRPAARPMPQKMASAGNTALATSDWQEF
jgi:methyl-accepting chemotaxis protein